MDASLRKRFMSPFSASRERSKGSFACSLQREQWSMPSAAPLSASAARVSKSESVMSSDRSDQEKGLKPVDLTMTDRNISERGSRQKVCRALFSIKPTGCAQKSDLEQQSYLKKQTHSEKEAQICGSSMSDFLGASNRTTPISLVELSSPEIASEATLMNATVDSIMQAELIGQHTKVEVQCPFDFCGLLKPEFVGKFKSEITPRKAHLPPLTSLLDFSTEAVIICLVSQDFCAQNLRQKKNKEKLVEIPMAISGESASSGISLSDGNASADQLTSGIALSKKHHLQEASLCESMFSDLSCGKRRMIRGFSVPRCGRLSNQSYQEQAKEFEEILSSKVRQVVEVADCLQHTEVLYKILEI